MKKTLALMTLSVALAAAFGGASAASAQTLNNPTAQNSDNPEDAGFQLIPCDGVVQYQQDAKGNLVKGADGKPVPVEGSVPCDYKQLMVLANRVVNFLLYLAIPLSMAMLMYIAFTYLTANGEPSKIASAKGMFKPFMLGLFWILAAFVIVKGALGFFLADDIGGSKDSGSFINKYLGN